MWVLIVVVSAVIGGREPPPMTITNIPGWSAEKDCTTGGDSLRAFASTKDRKVEYWCIFQSHR